MKYFSLLIFIFFMKGAMSQLLSPMNVKESACNYVDSILKGENPPQPPNNPVLLGLSQNIVYACSYTCQVGVQQCDEIFRMDEETRQGIYCDDKKGTEYDNCVEERDELYFLYEIENQQQKQAYEDSCFIPTAEDCASMAEKTKQCAKEMVEHFSSEECN